MQRFKNILCYVGTEDSETAINRAATLALENKANLTLMDVVKPLPRALGIMTDMAERAELQTLLAQDHREKLLDRATAYIDTGVPIDVIVSTGDPACEIVRQVLVDDHDLVVKTADGLSAAGRLFGSVARSLLRICPCPLWLLKPEIHGSFDCVLAAVDVEPDDKAHRELNQKILELAFSIAQQESAAVHVVSAWNLWMEQPLRRRAGDQNVDAALAQYESRVHHAMDELLQAPLAEVKNIHVHVQRGLATNVIRSVADQVKADLMVMGTVCRTGAAGFFIGNTAETVLTDVTCSVLAVKPDGFVSPVRYVEPASPEYSESTSSPS